MPEDTQRRNRRQYEWKKAARDRMEILLPKGRKAEMQALAEMSGKTLSQWVNEAIDRKIEEEMK